MYWWIASIAHWKIPHEIRYSNSFSLSTNLRPYIGNTKLTMWCVDIYSIVWIISQEETDCTWIAAKYQPRLHNYCYLWRQLIIRMVVLWASTDMTNEIWYPIDQVVLTSFLEPTAFLGCKQIVLSSLSSIHILTCRLCNPFNVWRHSTLADRRTRTRITNERGTFILHRSRTTRSSFISLVLCCRCLLVLYIALTP